MTSLLKHKWWLAVLVSQAVAAQSANGAELDLGGEVTVLSDYMFRGVSQTMSQPAIQGSLNIESRSGWYGSLWLSNVDFTESRDPDDGANLELNIEFGYFHELSDRTAVSVGWIRYLFPDLAPGYSYSYNEWLGSLVIDERHSLSIGYSRDVFAEDAPGTFYAAGTVFDLSEQTGIDIELGYYDLDHTYENSYSYAELAIFGRAQLIHWRLSYFTTSNEARQLFPESTVGDRVVFAVGVAF